eukprot:3768883-Pyramimonas_sp.AAC.2
MRTVRGVCRASDPPPKARAASPAASRGSEPRTDAKRLADYSQPKADPPAITSHHLPQLPTAAGPQALIAQHGHCGVCRPTDREGRAVRFLTPCTHAPAPLRRGRSSRRTFRASTWTPCGPWTASPRRTSSSPPGRWRGPP